MIATVTRPGDKFSPVPGPELGSGKYLTPEPGPGPRPASKHFTSRDRSRDLGDRKHPGTGTWTGVSDFSGS